MVISILYVDDEEDLRILGLAYLSREPDFLCTCASSVKEALVCISTQSFDVIVTDYQMPEMTGLEMLKELSIRNVNTPVILFTGRGREEVAIEAFNLGATFYVQKGSPVKAQFQELIHKIRIAVDRDRTRKKLVESEQRFHSFFTHSLLGSAILDASFITLEVNDYLCNLLGLKRDTLVSRYFPDIISGHDMNIPNPKNGQIPSGQFDLSYKRPDEVVIALRLAISPITEKQGISGYSVLVSNINAEKELQDRYDEIIESWSVVAEQESGIRSVLNALGDSGMLLDHSGRILFFNKRAGETFGLSSSIEPYNLCSILNERVKPILLQALTRAGETGLDQVFSTAELGRSYEWSIHPIKGTKSYKSKFVLFCRDNTEFHEISGELKASKELYHQFSEFLPQSLFEIDTNGMLVYLNPFAQTVLQVSSYDIENGIHYEELVHAQCLDLLRDRVSSALQGQGGKPMEAILVRKTGEIFPAFLQILPVRQKNKIIGEGVA